MSSDFIVGLDVGTTKVSVLIGELSLEDDLRIIGAGSAPSEGIKKGVVVNIEQAAERVCSAKNDAEKMAGVEIQGVSAGLSGPHIKSFNSRGVISIPPKRPEITARDVARVSEAARSITLPFDREIIHSEPQDYVVDRQGEIRDPIGMSATRLEAEVHIVTGLGMPIENYIKVIKRADLEPVNLVFEPLAAACAVLVPEEMEGGCLLIDVGGGVTSYGLFYGGCIRASGVISVGGDNITNDLAIGLRTSLAVAEKLKVGHGVASAAMADEDMNIMVPSMDGHSSKEVRSQILAAIIEPRCEEIFSIIKQTVSSNTYYRMLGGGVVLTGGGSRITGMGTVAEQVFDLPVRTGGPCELRGLTEVCCDESWSTCVGLLLYERDSVPIRTDENRLMNRFRWMIDGVRKVVGMF
jgi:cell division protein FtsA